MPPLPATASPSARAAVPPDPAAVIALIGRARGLRFLGSVLAGWLALRLCWSALTLAEPAFMAPPPAPLPNPFRAPAWQPAGQPALGDGLHGGRLSRQQAGAQTMQALRPSAATMAERATGPIGIAEQARYAYDAPAGGLTAGQRHWLRAMLVMARLDGGTAALAGANSASVWQGAAARPGPFSAALGKVSAAPMRPLSGGVPDAASRVRVDGWAFFQGGGGTASAGTGGSVPSVLGASQWGLRAAWRPADAPGMHLFGRISGAPGRGGGTEAAAGLALRPVKGLPIDLALERRVRVAGTGRGATAVYAAGGVDDAPLAGAASLSGYGQAGVVDGRGGPIWFADGQMAAAVPVTRADAGRMRLDLGALAAAAVQDGPAQAAVQRVDIGPRATLRWHGHSGATPVDARLSVDWRARVAGDAAPASGLAITLAAGF